MHYTCLEIYEFVWLGKQNVPKSDRRAFFCHFILFGPAKNERGFAIVIGAFEGYRFFLAFCDGDKSH